MANVVRVRAELKNKHNDPYRNHKELMHEFKKGVENSGIMHKYKEHQVFESKSEKRRKKRNNAIKKTKREALEKKILSGARVKAPSNVVKKILSNDNKKKTRYA